MRWKDRYTIFDSLSTEINSATGEEQLTKKINSNIFININPLFEHCLLELVRKKSTSSID